MLTAPAVFVITVIMIGIPRVVPTASYTVLVLFVGLSMPISLALRTRVATMLKSLCDYVGGISYPLYAIHYLIRIAVAYLLGKATALISIASAGVVVAATSSNMATTGRYARF